MVAAEPLVMTAEEILGGPDYFTCERFRCRMPIETCIARQKTMAWPGYGGIPSVKYLECVDCAQGRENRNTRGETMEEKKSKVCRFCGEEKRMEEFYKSPGCEDGHDSVCKKCRNNAASERQKKRRHGKPENREQRQEKPGMQLCRKCGKEKPLTEFGMIRGKYYERRCKACKAAQVRAHRLRTQKKMEELEQQVRDANMAPEPPVGIPAAIEPFGLVIDLGGYPEVADELAEQARVNIRTVEHQALYYIVRGLKEVRHDA